MTNIGGCGIAKTIALSQGIPGSVIGLRDTSEVWVQLAYDNPTLLRLDAFRVTQAFDSMVEEW